MKVLLTNDDGITASGLHAFRHALLGVPGIELAVIAPDSNRSAIGRGITTRDPLYVEQVDFGDGTSGFATDGTPVDCVRFATLGLLPFTPDLIVSGINHGANLGDDITYSGTVAAAFEGVILDIPAIAVSQQAVRGEMGWHFGGELDFETGAASRPVWWSASKRCRCRRARCSTSTFRLATSRACASVRSASASTVTALSSRAKRAGQALPDLRRRSVLRRRGRHGLRGDRRRLYRGDAGAFRSHRSHGHG